MIFEDFYPTFEEIRELQEKHFSQSISHLLSKEESDKLYGSQKYKDCIGEGDYINDQEEGIWTEWYECKFRDEKDLNMLRHKSLFAHVDKLIDQSGYIEEGEEKSEEKSFEKINSEDFCNYLLIKKRLREFNGCMKIVSNYVSGKKEYLSTGYGENNEVLFKCHYKNDNFHGRFTEWYENGKIKLECNYIDGKLDGHLTRWWDDGERMLDSNYKNGILDGDEIYHNKERMIVWTRTGPRRV